MASLWSFRTYEDKGSRRDVSGDLVRKLPHPGMGGGGVGCFLTKSPETSLRLPLSSYVLNDHQEAMGSPPTWVGIGDG